MGYPERVDISGAVLARWCAVRHTAGFAAACADPEVMRFLGGPMTLGVATEMSRRIEEHWSVFGFGLWAVVVDGVCRGFSGACRALWHPEHADRTEVGWRLDRSVWGRGFATVGGQAGARAVFGELGLREVVAFVHPGNVASVAVVDRLGMELLGMTRDPNRQEEIRMYRLRVTDAAPRPSSGGPRRGG